MSNERLPAKRQSEDLVFDPRATSPMVRRGLLRLDAQERHAVLLWHFSSPHLSSERKVVVAAGVAYVGLFDGLCALDTVTGIERWRFEATFDEGSRKGGATPLGVVDGRVVIKVNVSDHVGTLCALDAATAHALWCRPFDPGYSEGRATVVDGVLYVVEEMYLLYESDGDIEYDRETWNRLLAYDASTGRELWRIEYEGDWLYSVQTTQISNGFLYTFMVNSSGYCSLVAVDITTGTEVWSYPMASVIYDGNVKVMFFSREIRSLVIIDNEDGTYARDPEVAVSSSMVYIDHGTGTFSALDPSTGKECWRIENADGLRMLLVADGEICVAIGGDGGRETWALDSETGVKRWRIPRVGVSAAARGAVYVVDEVPDAGCSALYALDAQSGSERWRFVPGEWLLKPMIVDDIIYLVSRQHLYALDTNDGFELWRFAFNPPHSSHAPLKLKYEVSLEVVGDVVFAIARDTLYALRYRRPERRG